MIAIVLLFGFTMLAQSFVYAQTGDTDAGAAPTISGVRAHLFHNKSAELSQDLLAAGRDGAWNIVAGPNAANATLVVVEVSGPPGATYTGYFGPKTKYLLRVVAREGGRAPKLLLDRTQGIPVLSDQGKVYLAYLVYPNGCAPVKLSARIVGTPSSKPLERSLNFACGE